MNILMTLSQLEVTGAEVYAVTLGNRLIRRGHRVIFISDTLTHPVEGRYIPLAFNRRSIPRRVWQITKLVWLIKRYRIQIVHAHSRASSWPSQIACWLTRTPLVSTVHGRQPNHRSRRFFKAFGSRIIAVCEAVKTQLVGELNVSAERISVIRNGIDKEIFYVPSRPSYSIGLRPRVAIVGRLTGPKGELCKRLLTEALDLERLEVVVVTNSVIAEDFKRFASMVTFVREQSAVVSEIRRASLVVGAGRVAVEALFSGVPVYAIGESGVIGLVTTRNIDEGMRTNFGDIGESEPIDFSRVRLELEQLLHGNNAQIREDSVVSPEIQNRMLSEYDLESITTEVLTIYQDEVVARRRREMPILMYHRFTENPEEEGVHGTWIQVESFERHLKLIKRMGFETLTFRDIEEKGPAFRLEPGRRCLMITVDDGYRDNLTRMLPLLEKYGIKATVFVVTGETYNRWDTENEANPEVEVPLLNREEILALEKSGYVEIGGHTVSHSKLHELDSAEQEKEINDNRDALAEILGYRPLSFAYPFGYIDNTAKELVQAAGYKYGLATDSGPRAFHCDRYQIRRIAVFPKTSTFGLWRKIRGDYVFRK